MTKKRTGSAPTAAAIRNFFSDTPHPAKLDDVLRALGISRAFKKNTLDLLNDLTDRGLLIRLRGGRFTDVDRLRLIKGVVSVLKSGDAFVIPERRHREKISRDIFIPRDMLHGAWHNDLVEASVFPASSKTGLNQEGRIIGILQRRTTELTVRPVSNNLPFGRRTSKKNESAAKNTTARNANIKHTRTSDRSGEVLYLCRPADSRYPMLFNVDMSKIDHIPGEDELIIVAPIAQIDDNLWTATALRTLGNENDVAVQERLTRINHKIPIEFPADSEAEAAVFADAPPALPECTGSPARMCGSGKRMDLRDLPFVTIDSEDARDFDDAVCTEVRGEKIFLWIAIADVGLYVRPRTAIDREAFTRGNSYYFPTSVTPMLPEILCNDLCSLRPGTERPVMAVRLTCGKRGDIKSAAFTSGIIRSRARLTYTEVQAHYDGEKRIGEPLASMLDTAKPLAEAMIKRRSAAGSLDLDLPEAQFVTKNNITVAVKNRERLFAHRLIEAFMVAANEAAARFLTEKNIPFPLRAHPAPDSDKTEALFASLRETPLADRVPADSNIKNIAALLTAAKNTPQNEVVSRMILRSMMQARYIAGPTEEAKSLHFGLASSCYCHFTSPIRRYADLMVHRALKTALGTDDADQIPARKRLLAGCEQCNERERAAQDAEREITKRLSCLLLEKHIGEKFHATVSGITDFGFFAELRGWYADGLVRLADIRSERFYFDEKRGLLIGCVTKRTIGLGNEVCVKLQSVNIGRLEIDLILEEPTESAPSDEIFISRRRRPHAVLRATLRQNEKESLRGQKQAWEAHREDTKKPVRRRRRR